MKNKILVFMTLLVLLIPFASAQVAPGWGYDCNGGFGYGYSCSETGHHNPTKGMTAELSSGCQDNVVTVSAGAGAQVTVVDTSPSGGVIFSGVTDSDGNVHFPGCSADPSACGVSVNVYVSKSGYSISSPALTETLLDVGQCAAPECTSDGQCSSDQVCSANQKCVPITCDCGSAANHKCVNYECCSDTQCSGGKICQEHSCKQRPEVCTAPGCCTAASQCADNQNCLTVTGAPASANAPGSCHDITGQCGQVKGHEFVPYGYECGTEPGCPSCPQGKTCTDHKCVGSDLQGPQTGFVGDNAKVKATEADAPCIRCSLQITGPDGKKLTGQTDANGNFDLPLVLQGNYTVSLLKDGVVVKTILVNALPKAPPGEGSKPTAAGGGDLLSMAWVVLLLLIIVGGIYLYSRGKGKK